MSTQPTALAAPRLQKLTDHQGQYLSELSASGLYRDVNIVVPEQKAGTVVTAHIYDAAGKKITHYADGRKFDWSDDQTAVADKPLYFRLEKNFWGNFVGGSLHFGYEIDGAHSSRLNINVVE